ncbi:3-oxoacyl-[acyl-carrier-protein] reductase FabG [Komagataeibacter saccharivorans]|uniref:SDR family NAD(P)-dependent oxidoreductase n=1 Tax=Komagataeibacter saccharivorans TaxID=265959 RepID=UPI0010C33308|nr:SDR family oxidoreductase [Komagataeibacter saccharivorans]QBL93749.1 3-oxoacyl-[acyl-carrier-protein] reductase FabG [Komagataeibacter saccharivorans]
MADTAPIALVTGGDRGLGLSMIRHLARQGVDIILTYRSNLEGAQAVAAELTQQGRRVRALQLDVADTAGFDTFAGQVAETLAQWQASHFNFLVNNAGIGIHAPLMETTEAQFDTLVNIHLKGTFFLTQKLVPLMADGGRILNISTGLTRFCLPGYGAYAAMKGAIEVLTRYQATELAARKITVNTLAPGAIETDFGGGAVRDNSDINGYVASVTALGRAGRPDDIGGVVAALLGPDTGWINAQRIEASGGMKL